MTPSLGTIAIDLPRLLETRMLIQSNSGGGKSHTLRRVLEQTAPHVQQLVIDPDGEFPTLRERFDYIVCAPSGADAVATPQTAAALAQALWRSGSSAILDIYELKKHERVLFVRRFLESLIAAPKSAWHPTLVAVDEVHDFCPQVGSAESAGAIIDLATRGRKRGLALLGATQRIAKLHKDCAAELLNKAIGRTGLDIDVRRAADELGMSNYREALETLRNLDPGEFFVFGPALTRSVERTRIGPVITTHPETGQKALAAPPPASAKVKAQLAKIEGLQLEAEEEVKTVAALAGEVAALKRKLTIAEKAQGGGVPEAEVQRRVREAVAASPPTGIPDSALRAIAKAIEALQAIGANSGATPSPVARSPRLASPREPAPPSGPVAAGVTAPQQRILDALAQLETFGLEAPAKGAVAAHAGASPKSSGYTNNLGAMRARGLIDYPAGGCVALAAGGRELANFPAKPPTLVELQASWLRLLTRPQQAIVEALIAAHPASVPKAALADRAGASASSSGYTNNLGSLRTLGLLDYPQPGHVVATALLFPKGNP